MIAKNLAEELRRGAEREEKRLACAEMVSLATVTDERLDLLGIAMTAIHTDGRQLEELSDELQQVVELYSDLLQRFLDCKTLEEIRAVAEEQGASIGGQFQYDLDKLAAMNKVFFDGCQILGEASN